MRFEFADRDVVGLAGDRAEESIDDGAGLLTHAGNGTTDNPFVATRDPDRYPDLTGKAVIAVGTTDVLLEVTRRLAAHHMLIAVVASDRDLVQRCVGVAEALGAMVNGFTVDPADPVVWQRIAPHIEQRLGPIDVVIAVGDEGVRATVAAALVPDMLARHRGVLVEIGADDVAPLTNNVRRYAISGDLPAHDIAATAVRLASDTARP